jgi:hypothetical protein
MFRQSLLPILLFALPAFAQKYSGPRPPKPDIPYLLHADTLVETEVTEAKEQNKKDEITYVVPGAESPAKTPLASPILLLQAEKISAEQLQLYRLEVKNGQREVLFSKKKKQTARPIRMNVNRITSDNLYKIEVDESLTAGQYSLTPEGSNTVFCFQVF